MSAPPSFRLLSDFDPALFLPSFLVGSGGGVVEVADAALRDHRLDLAVQSAGEEDTEFHFEAGGGLDNFGVDEDLVGFAEAEGHGCGGFSEVVLSRGRKCGLPYCCISLRYCFDRFALIFAVARRYRLIVACPVQIFFGMRSRTRISVEIEFCGVMLFLFKSCARKRQSRSLRGFCSMSTYKINACICLSTPIRLVSTFATAQSNMQAQ